MLVSAARAPAWRKRSAALAGSAAAVVVVAHPLQALVALAV